MSKKQFVTVTANEEGQIIVPSKSSEGWGYIRVEKKTLQRDPKSGIMNLRNRSAIVRAEIPTLEFWMEENGVTKAGDKVPGKIVVLEQAGEPFRPDQQPKTAGENGEELVDENGELIYRDTYFVHEDDITENDRDVLVAHTNVITYTGETVENNVDAGATEK